jgi:uncharacterized protein (DUF1800 family)
VEDLERLLDVVCAHPSTAKHLAGKLARRFVADDPPRVLVDRAATLFSSTGGDVGAVIRAILTSDEFRASAGAKVKRPFEFVASALRAVAADTHAHSALTDYLGRMGQAPFQHPTPDGYADEAMPWLGTLLWRWNFAFALSSGQIPGVDVPLAELVHALGATEPERLFAHCIGRAPTAAEAAALDAFLATRPLGGDAAADALALVLASPAFQRH